jgi:ribosome-associated toxin RatA of RatAB toxin-antitoxin module
MGACETAEEASVTEQLENVIARHSICASAQTVWAALLNPDSFTGDVENVRSAKLSLVHDERREVRWVVWLKGFELTWREVQRADHSIRRLEFEQQEGMFRIYRGRWDVSASPGNRCEIALQIELDTGLPYLALHINPVIAGAFTTLAQELLTGIERAVARSLLALDGCPPRNEYRATDPVGGEKALAMAALG